MLDPVFDNPLLWSPIEWYSGMTNGQETAGHLLTRLYENLDITLDMFTL